MSVDNPNPKNSRYILATLFVLVLAVPLPFSCLKNGKEKHVELKKKEHIVKYDNYLKETPDIRVMLLKNTKNAELEISSSYRITDIDSNRVLARGNSLPRSTMFINSGELRIRPISSRTVSRISAPLKEVNGKIRISPQNDGFVKLNNTKYSGDLLVISKESGRFSVLEELDVEDYLPGVIENEMPLQWHDDAILAQVVAARSFAIYQKAIKKNSQHHIDKIDLAYGGSYKNTTRTKEMVARSSGVVMVYKWELFPGYFHSTCGGHTEDIGLVFGQKSILPLSGVGCGHCGNSKYYRWKKEIKKNEIESKLRNSKTNMKNVLDVVGENAGPGGHYSRVKVKHSRGIQELNANDFRIKIGPNKLFSTAFNTRSKGNSLIFEGKGWGHGVGLCQYGSQDMAKSGFEWFEILRHYYPGIELVKIY